MRFEQKVERIVTRGAEIDGCLVPWDTEILGIPVAQIDRIVVRVGEEPTEGMRQLQSWMDEQQIRLVSCRLDSRDLRESTLLEVYGFRFIETPTLAPIVAQGVAEQGLAIEEAGELDLPAIEAIAGTAFATGRYKLDGRIDPVASDRRYRIWVRNSFDNLRHQVLKATLARELVGFFIVEERPDLSAYWHLTAVAPAFQGKRLGKRLWSAMVERHQRAGHSRMETTISAHNPSVTNIYEALGFTFGSPQMTFHWARD